MKKIITLIMMTLFVQILSPLSGHALPAQKEMRAVWISTVYNLDFPNSQYKGDPEAQKQQYIEILDELETLGINTVIVQVRPKVDALYESVINPWSDVLTGTQGKYPGYDPLEFMIQETHKRGMDFHAWLNPYRVTTSGTDLSILADNHPAKQNPDWVMSYNNALYYNPEHEGVKQHIVETVREIVEQYDVDGIHFDDYFYPSRYPLPSGEDKDGEVAQMRRGHVNEMVRRVSKVIKQTNSKVEFGISPSGIWKNSKSDPTGSATTGSESYYTVYADTRTWIQNEWIDYVVPQIYWEIGHTAADYETLVKWWAKEVQGTQVNLYIGQGIYKDEVANQITSQLLINDKYPEVKGSIYFSLRDLLQNRGGAKQQIQAFYHSDDLIPEVPAQPENPEIPQIPEQSGEIKLVIDGQYIIPPVAPVIQKGTTLVPLRVISENLDAIVNWEPVTKQITISRENQIIELKIGNPIVKIGDSETMLATSPQIIGETTMVPIRFISENLGAMVDWNSNEKIVTIDSK